MADTAEMLKKVAERELELERDSGPQGPYDARKLGADLDAGHLHAVEMDAGRSGVSVAEYHSQLAMEAARKMRRTRQKLRTGQEVCHHLRMMLAQPVTREEPATDSRDRQQIALGF